MRQLLLFGGPLVVPLAAYFLWFQRRRAAALAAGVEPPRLGDAPWPWLIAAGLILVAGLLAGVALMGGGRPGDSYLPPHLENGEVVPGRSVPSR